MILTLRMTLCETRDALKALRKLVAVGGHLSTMQDVDTFLLLAQDETRKLIAAIDVS